MGLGEADIDRLRAVVADNTFDRRFEVLRESGRGAMGCVFEARDRQTDARVALKLLLGVGDRARFVTEAEVLERLDHPAIVKYVRHGATGGGDPYLVMEWLAGETLARRLARGPLDCLEAATLGERLASALEAAHAARIIHRDLKPSNVFLVDGRVEGATLIDFGVAKTERVLTRTGQMVGTPGYMAPEQVRGERGVDARVDLFALGCVLYEAVSGRPPFAANEVIEVLARLLLETPPPLDGVVAGVPPRLARFVGALLDKDPERRLADAATACAELAAIRAAIARDDREALAAPGSDAAPADSGPRTVGRYVLRELLGTGGMGVVFAADDPELGRPVAVKLLRPDLAQGASGARLEDRLRREAQALAQLAHPNVIAVHDVGVHDGRIFVAMELVAGRTLARWLTARRTRREILDAFVAAGRGLAAAHAAGLVHRDFKPENVLVGDDGRVRVVDFGIVRNADDATATAIATASAPASAEAPTLPAGLGSAPGLTAAGSAPGTPYYMAPEQHRGEPAGARSDQFSFCVALHAALYGERPFAGDSLEELAATVCEGRAIEPRRTRGVSRRVRAAIRRGLAGRPADRFPSMDALLDALAPRARRGVWIAAAAAAGVAATIAVALAVRSDPPAPCGGAADHLRGVWDPWRKLAVASGLFGTRAPYAEATWREVTGALDRYASEWQAMHRGACEATRVRGEQTEDILELRMACLDERLHGLGGLATTLAAPDRAIAEHAVAAAHGLPAVDACADLAALQSPVRAPSAAAKHQVDALRGELAGLRARRDAGDATEPILAAARPALARARGLGYRPVEAEALGLVALLERDRETYAASRTTLEQSILAAEAGRHDRQAAASLIELIAVLDRGLDRHADVGPLRDRVRAVLERLDHPPQLEAHLLETLGQGEVRAGEVVAGERDLRAALAAWERLYGRDDLHLVDALRGIAQVALERERGADARALLDRALAIQHRVLGDDHPELARTLSMMAGSAHMVSRSDEAIALYRRAEAIFARATGPDSMGVAEVLTNLATIYQHIGKNDEALAIHRRAIAIAEQRLGADHSITLSYRTGYAVALTDAGHPKEALDLLAEVLAKQRAHSGPDHQWIAMTLELMANVEIIVARYAAARDHAREALAMFQRVLGAGYDPYADLRVLGEALIGTGEAAAAVDALERARGMIGPAVDPGNAAWLDGLLGRALIESGRDPVRGRRLIAGAWPAISGDPRLDDQEAELAAWLRGRGLAVPAR